MAFTEALRQIPDRAKQVGGLVRRIPSPRQKPLHWIMGTYAVLLAAGSSARSIHTTDEAKKSAQVAAQQSAAAAADSARRNPPAEILPDGRITISVDPKGNLTVNRFLTHYLSVDSRPQETIPFKITSKPDNPNTFYIEAIGQGEASDAESWIKNAKKCQLVGAVQSTTSEGLVKKVVPVANGACLNPTLDNSAS